MSRFVLNTTMLLVHMEARMTKMNSMFEKNRKKRYALPTSIRLRGFNRQLGLFFNNHFEDKKDIKGIRFSF